MSTYAIVTAVSSSHLLRRVLDGLCCQRFRFEYTTRSRSTSGTLDPPLCGYFPIISLPLFYQISLPNVLSDSSKPRLQEDRNAESRLTHEQQKNSRRTLNKRTKQ